MLKVSNSSHLPDSAVQNISAPTTAPANNKTSTTANTPGVQTTAEPATTNQTKNYASADTAANLLHFDTSTLEAASATGMASQTPMQIAQDRTLSLQEKKAAALQAKQLRQDLQTFSLTAQLGTPGQTPLQRTRTMLTLANNTNNLRARDFVRLSNQLNLYENRGHRLTPEALETFNTQLKSALETGAQHRAAFQLFDKGGLVNDLYQIIQLGDIKPLQNASAALKERIGTSTESLYQYGEGGQLAAALTEMTANTAVDIFFPTNLPNRLSVLLP